MEENKTLRTAKEDMNIIKTHDVTLYGETQYCLASAL